MNGRRLTGRCALFCLTVLLLASCGSAPAYTAVPGPAAVASASTTTLALAFTATSVAATPMAVVATAGTASATAPGIAVGMTAAAPPALASTVAPTPPTPTAQPTATALPPTPAAQRTAMPEISPSAEPPTPSPVPAQPSPRPTSTPQEPAVTARPVVLSLRVTPTTTLNVGDELAIAWKSAGQRAELCPISGPGPVEARCQEVPLTGNTRFVTDEEAMAYVGFGLRVTSGGTASWSVVDVYLQCQNLRPWFFSDPPRRCPASLAHESYAAGQYFERGLMVWVEDPDSFYVFYRGQDEQGFQVFDWITVIQLKAGASPDHRVGEQPPPGLYEPISGFGMVWRGEIEGVRTDVRQRLGWATAPEFGFEAAYQCETTFYPGLWDCFLRGPSGETLYLRPDSTAQVRLLWEEWPPGR